MTRYENSHGDTVLDFTGDEPAATRAKRGPLPRCPDCGHVASTKPHAPHWRDGRRVDCQGRPVP